MENSAEVTYSDVPREILTEIFAQCDEKTLLNPSQTNKKNSEISDKLYAKVISECFPWIPVDEMNAKDMKFIAINANRARKTMPINRDDAREITDRYCGFVSEYIKSVAIACGISPEFFGDCTADMFQCDKIILIGNNYGVESSKKPVVHYYTCDIYVYGNKVKGSRKICSRKFKTYDNKKDDQTTSELSNITQTIFMYILPAFSNISEIILQFDHHAIAHIPDYVAKNINIMWISDIPDNFSFDVVARFTSLKALSIIQPQPEKTYNIPKTITVLKQLEILCIDNDVKLPREIEQVTALRMITIYNPFGHIRKKLDSIIGIPIKSSSIIIDGKLAKIILDK